MMNPAGRVEQPKKANRFTKVTILVITGFLAFLSLVLPESFSQSSYPMQIGDVATEDILAPYSLTYESEVLTESARQDAAALISPIYLPVDPSIGRLQIEALRTVLYYITLVRLDDYATQEEKVTDIQSIEGLSLSGDSITRILQFSESRWEAIESETANVLEQVMRNTLRDTDIFSAKRNVASLVDFSFPEEQANVVVELVQSFIVPNSLYSAEETDAAIEEARQSVSPVIRSFISGETLVNRGQLIKDVDWEALERYGLIQTGDSIQGLIGAAIFSVLLTILVGLYFKNQTASEDYPVKALLLIAIVFLVFLSIARFIVFNRTILPYVYPLAAFGLTLSVVFNFELAGFLTLLLGAMTAYGMPNGFDLTIFYIIPSIVGMLSLGKARRISAFVGAGASIGLAGIAIIIAYRLPDSVTDWIGIATLSATSLINGFGAAAMTLLLQYLFSQSLGTTTPLQLLDTSRPDHPLLQLLLREAPGSYQHSLQVANLAEQAAEAIGADGLLVRVGAIYHDCGKSQNPHFFIENQVKDKLDPHDNIDPAMSAQTIIRHVTDGVELAKKYHIPTRLIDFIREHHGTLFTQYQYTQAVKAAGDPDLVDKSLFTYPGPRPQSRETALLMLADGTEARARAIVPKDEAELRELINQTFDFIEKNGQLDDTNLTLRDLQSVKDSFFYTLMGTYHPRVKYPTLEKPSAQPVKQLTSETVKSSENND
ncbi:MAG: HDIG domain-containing protein [Anaerolineaceae bacterium]|nr:HDIG domain-containing protein [Anaerolineaceae bacterium]